MNEETFAYVSRRRYHGKSYPYRIALEDKGDELVIQHQGIIDNKWRVTHSIGIRRADLIKMLEAIDKK